ncbi:recombinase family protein [[Mycobacterium] holstebronense]|uniref:Recombinase family protein n=1 Tax=[Mycobacterium] holstebronense TaxID=3064288 RepID=A0ABM9LSZ2_9MYCO|nr:recombinase family protein [Mycolicibacter sp. MU0102]CAJ1504226.1 recombinase family protein [Mycolicibacter sp. MU0102]
MTAPRRRRTAPVGSVIAYTRVSTDEQVASGAGLEAQRAAIAAEADRRGWQVIGWYADEGVSGGKGVECRPGLAAAIEAIEDAEAAVLMVAKTDRVARGLRTLLEVIDRVEAAGGAVVSVDGTIDTSSAAGRFQTQIMGSVAELERALISDRTKAALAVKRAQGVRLGGPSSVPLAVVARIIDGRARGESLTALAAGLNTEGVPTARGGARWYPSTIRAVIHGQDAERLRAERAELAEAEAVA